MSKWGKKQELIHLIFLLAVKKRRPSGSPIRAIYLYCEFLMMFDLCSINASNGVFPIGSVFHLHDIFLVRRELSIVWAKIFSLEGE